MESTTAEAEGALCCRCLAITTSAACSSVQPPGAMAREPSATCAPLHPHTLTCRPAALTQVRIERSDDCQSVSVRGLYPCGEGAGYAGGIVSAAVDGLRVGEALVREVSGVAADAGEAGRMKGMGALSKY